VNGLMDVLKLQLTQVLYLALLIVAVQLAAVGFPYQSAQGTAITLATVALPSIGLSLWAVAGRLPRASLGRLLSRFVIPAAVTICVAALVVYLYFLDTSDLAYAQLAVTWSLVSIGLVLSVLAKPPWPTRVRGAIRPGDWRPLLLALVVLALFVVVCAIPLLQELLKVAWLQKPEHYGLIALVTLVWALVVNVIWWIWPVERRR
jgi:hypothetical protein